MSPTQRSRPRSSSSRRRCPWSSTCGRRGAGRARRSGRSSRRSSTPPTARSCWPRSTSTRTRRSARRSRCSRSPRCSRCGTARSSTGSSAPTPSRRCSGSSTACCRPRRRARSPTLIAAGDEASLRQALELEPGNEDAIVALGELLVERGDGDGGARPARADPRDRAHPQGRRRGPRRRTPRPTTTTPRSTDLLDRVKDDDEARQAVRRHPRADGPRRPAHRRLPPPPHRPAVLTSRRSTRRR